MQRISKRLKTALTVVLSLILFVIVLFFGMRGYFRLPVKDFYSVSERAFKIPAIGKGFVPQGFCYDGEKQVFLVSGYSSKDKPSSIHVVDRASGKTLKAVELLNEDGSPNKGHAGGIAQFKDWVYVAGSSDCCLYVYSYSEISGEAKQVKPIGEFSLKTSDNNYVKASFVSAMDGKLVVGEFYREPNYKTLDSHKITSKNGEKFGGLAVEFMLNEKYEYGIVPNPMRAYALPDEVQGIHFSGDTIYLSVSYGLKHSYVYEYSTSLLEKAEPIELLTHKNLELNILNQGARINSYKLMPMSEEITVVDGKLYVMSEFACNKYFIGKLTGAKWCYATDLSAI